MIAAGISSDGALGTAASHGLGNQRGWAAVNQGLHWHVADKNPEPINPVAEENPGSNHHHHNKAAIIH